MNIKPTSNDIHIDMGRINGTIAIDVDGVPHAINFSMTVEDAERAATDDVQANVTITNLSDDDDDECMSAKNQADHIRRLFKAALNLTDNNMVHVWFTDEEEIVVQVDEDRSRQWTYFIASDDDGYYHFRLWIDGRLDHGIVEMLIPYPEA